ncbi:MAG: hypothetical protein LBT66_08860 [Methanobrevibacter sp.]|jgi:hypothetical protein|nr:hypothetical protein [Candidatus Methanovirga meridionalis]
MITVSRYLMKIKEKSKGGTKKRKYQIKNTHIERIFKMIFKIKIRKYSYYD